MAERTSKKEEKIVTASGEEVLLDVSPEICAEICTEYAFPVLTPGKKVTLMCACGCDKTFEATFLGVGEDPICLGCPLSKSELCFDTGSDLMGIDFISRGKVLVCVGS
jgi:hypothetical protein